MSQVAVQNWRSPSLPFTTGFSALFTVRLILALFDSHVMIASPADEAREFARLFTAQHLWWAIAALSASHLYSFAVNFIGQKEFLRLSGRELMSQPYGRIFVLHIAILFGGWIAMALGSNVGVLFVLIVGKTLFDLKLHLHEHERIERAQTNADSADASRVP